MRAERFEQMIPVADIAHSRRFQELCKPCPHYGKNLACPPQSPYFPSYVADARSARVICFRIPLSSRETTVDEQKTIAREAAKALADELRSCLKQGHKVAGAGFCRSCPACVAESGGAVCCKPEERIFSLESMGVDVDSLLKKCFGFGLEWSKAERPASYLCVPGAVFHEKQEARS